MEREDVLSEIREIVFPNGDTEHECGADELGMIINLLKSTNGTSGTEGDMKQTTLDEALERSNRFRKLDEAVENLKALDKIGMIEKSRAVVRKSVQVEEALVLVRQGKIVYFKYDNQGRGLSGWIQLTLDSNIPLSILLKSEFETEVQARSISFEMKQRHPVASKRNAFEFQNEALDISIYGKKGTIPNSGKGIRVQITEIL